MWNKKNKDTAAPETDAAVSNTENEVVEETTDTENVAEETDAEETDAETEVEQPEVVEEQEAVQQEQPANEEPTEDETMAKAKINLTVSGKETEVEVHIRKGWAQAKFSGNVLTPEMLLKDEAALKATAEHALATGNNSSFIELKF